MVHIMTTFCILQLANYITSKHLAISPITIIIKYVLSFIIDYVFMAFVIFPCLMNCPANLGLTDD